MSGTAPAMIVRLPFARPEHPMPAIERPTINIEEEVATAHINEPTSKTARKTMYTH